jgi:Iron-containing redox enzyme
MNARRALTPVWMDSQRHARHSRLALFNTRRLKPGFLTPSWQTDLREDLNLANEEGRFVEDERVGVASLVDDVPTDADAFLKWFVDLRENGPGQNDELFPWLAAEATIEQMRWFLTQEVAGEAGFDDLVALTQIRFAAKPKLEMARNYWDEMGRGHEKGMHGGMLANTAAELDLTPTIHDTVSEALALNNLMVALAANRRYAYQSIGALGAIEMTAPGRVTLVNDGLRRLGVSTAGRQYFQLHAGLDIRHSEEWNREVIHPIVAADPLTAKPIAEGALMRLRCGERCFQRYRRELNLP